MEITFERRFRGPLMSANGGYACGRVAGFVDADVVEVTLRLPPPLERSLEVRRLNGDVHLLDGDELVAVGRPASLDLATPSPVSLDEAEAARTRHVRVGNPDFAECFACGVRNEGDGLGVYAGSVAGREPLHAAPVTFSTTGPEVVWAAIDCPGAYAIGLEGRGDTVLGRMTARIDRVPQVGETCVAVAWPIGEDGRKLLAGTALFAGEGELLAIARQTWIVPRV